MDNRVALIGIIAGEPAVAEDINAILHEYRQYIIGRMGLPYREKNISIISVIVDAPNNIISSISGKLGMLEGVNAKAIYSNVKG